MIFDTIQPESKQFIKPNYFKGSRFDKFLLGLSGYKENGEANIFGKITDFIPVTGTIKNLIGQKITDGTDSEANVADNMDNVNAKGQIGIGIGKTVAGAFSGNPELIKSGITDGIGGLGALSGAGSGANLEDDFKTKATFQNSDYASIYQNSVNRRDYNNINSDKRFSLFKKGGPITSEDFFAGDPVEKAASFSSEDPNFFANLASDAFKTQARSRVIERPEVDTIDPGSIKVKNSKVNLNGVSENILSYLQNDVPKELSSLVLATSGNDQHKIHKGHRNGELDIRFFKPLHDYISNDPVAKARGISVLDPNHGLKSGASTGKHDHLFDVKKSKIRFKIGGQLPFVPYAEDDDTEDFFMVDKMKAAEVGIFKLLDGMSFGEARYGERIFDQNANLAIKKIMSTQLDEEKKKDMLGDLIYDELLTHSDVELKEPVSDRIVFKQAFAKGNEITDPEIKRLMATGMSYNEAEKIIKGGGGVIAKLFNVDPAIYSEKAMGYMKNALVPNSIKKSIRKIGSTIDSGKAVMQSVLDTPQNISNMVGSFTGSSNQEIDKPKKIVAGLINSKPDGMSIAGGNYIPSVQQVDKTKTGSDSTGNGKVARTVGVKASIPRVDFQNEFRNDVLDAKYPDPLGQNILGLTNYKNEYINSNPNTPLSDIAATNTKQNPVKELESRPYNNQTNFGENSLPGGLNVNSPLPTTSPKIDSTIGGEKKDLTGFFDTAGDIARLAVGFANASQKTPDFAPSQDFIDRQNQIKAQAEQGFTSFENAQFEKNQNDAYDIGVNTIVNTSGGGANQAAVLGSLGSLQQQRLNSDLQYQIADDAKRMQNQGRYDQSLGQQLALDQNLYANKVAFINQNRNAGAQLIQGTMQNIQQRKIQQQSSELDATIADYYKSITTNSNNINQKQSSAFVNR